MEILDKLYPLQIDKNGKVIESMKKHQNELQRRAFIKGMQYMLEITNSGISLKQKFEEDMIEIFKPLFELEPKLQAIPIICYGINLKNKQFFECFDTSFYDFAYKYSISDHFTQNIWDQIDTKYKLKFINSEMCNICNYKMPNFDFFIENYGENENGYGKCLVIVNDLNGYNISTTNCYQKK